MAQKLPPIKQMIHRLTEDAKSSNPKYWTEEQLENIDELAKVVSNNETTITNINEMLRKDPKLMDTIFKGKTISGIISKLRIALSSKKNTKTKAKVKNGSKKTKQ